ncbi:ALPHA/BETA HYDROLASE FOLD-CONTAINING PROTEIN [Ceraceosorus bombacis]|uniref:ALPHA/BETA HYDROLASE FOLD-CONTAINING PROTEIN n=1 Tax=Ceraceosorus bombacis TaxID=401625 RepID=A0A0N7L928_9BASI|nr:ALPHA/BETA HYDROLASE FOLD-CONTAINING PROTEIN [Ceraceosorus bombacis]
MVADANAKASSAEADVPPLLVDYARDLPFLPQLAPISRHLLSQQIDLLASQSAPFAGAQMESVATIRGFANKDAGGGAHRYEVPLALPRASLGRMPFGFCGHLMMEQAEGGMDDAAYAELVRDVGNGNAKSAALNRVPWWVPREGLEEALEKPGRWSLWADEQQEEQQQQQQQQEHQQSDSRCTLSPLSPLSPPCRSIVVTHHISEDHVNRQQGSCLLAIHATGACKELLIPMIEAFLASTTTKISDIWLVDFLSHGETERANACRRRAGDMGTHSHDRIIDHNDLARDVLQFLHVFRPSSLHDLAAAAAAATREKRSTSQHLLPVRPSSAAKPSPIIALGHSVASTALIQAALHDPDMFQAVVAIEPIIAPFAGIQMAKRIPVAGFALRRTDTWQSAKHAREKWERSEQGKGGDAMIRDWHARCKQIFSVYGLRSDDPSGGVRLVCDKYLEACSLRFSIPALQLPCTLPHLSLPLLYLSASRPLMLPPDMVQGIAELAGSLVDYEVVQGGHFVPIERPEEVGKVIGRWTRLKGSREKL